MAFPEIRPLDLNEDPANPGDALVGQGKVYDARQMTEKGYEIERGAGAAIAGNIEGSVAGNQWATIVSLGASAQGAIPAHYNYIRADITTGGAIDSVVRIAGKVLF